jgi:hypothetical protein
MTDPKFLLLHYLDKYRTEPDPAKWRAAIVAMFDEREADAERLDWIGRQCLDDLCMSLVIDAPNDGRYFVRGDSGVACYGDTLRQAIDAARAKEVLDD